MKANRLFVLPCCSISLLCLTSVASGSADTLTVCTAPDCTCDEEPYCVPLTPDEPGVDVAFDSPPFDAFNASPHAGRAIVLTLSDPVPEHLNGLYVAWDRTADSTTWDQKADLRQANQRLVIPAARDALLYVHIEGYAFPNNVPYPVQLTAQVVPLAFADMTVRRIACCQCRFRTTILGGGFDEATEFHLELPGSSTRYDVIDTDIVSPQRAEVEFLCNDALETGSFDLVITKPGVPPECEVRVPGALEVTAPCVEGPLLKVQLRAPHTDRRGHIGDVFVRYENVGNEVMSPRIVKISAETDPPGHPVQVRLVDRDSGDGTSINPIRLVSGDPDPEPDSVYLLTVGPNGIPELAPGKSMEVIVAYLVDDPLVDRVTFTAALLTANGSDVAGFQPTPPAAEVIPPPPGMSPADWQTLLDHLQRPGQMDGRWINYDRYLTGLAERLVRRGVPTFSARELFRFAAAEALGHPRGSIVGTLKDVDGRTYEAAWVTATDVASGMFWCARTLEGGHYTFRCLPPGDYDISVVGGGGVVLTAVHVADGATLTDRDLVIAPVPSGTLPFDPPAGSQDCAALGGQLPEDVLRPNPAQADSLFTPLTETRVEIVDSTDPNEKEGPKGGDGVPAPDWGQPVSYRIRFQNTSAAIVWKNAIVDVLEANEFNLSSMQFSDFQYDCEAPYFLGSDVGQYYGYCDYEPNYTVQNSTMGVKARVRHPTVWNVPGGPSLPFQYFLDVSAQYDPYAQRATWKMVTLDRNNCYYPDYCSGCAEVTPGANVGFLPFNARGYVTFQVNLTSVPTLTGEVKNDADLTFDNGTTMTTNEHCMVPGTDLDCEEGGEGAMIAGDRGGQGAAALAVDFPVPADGRSMDVGRPLQWEAKGIPGPFTVEYWTGSPAVMNDLRTAGGLEQPCFYPEPLDPDTQYFWQVEAGGMSGPVWSFRTEPAAGSVGLRIQPIESASCSAVLAGCGDGRGRAALTPWEIRSPVGAGATGIALEVRLESELPGPSGVEAWSFSLLTGECPRILSATTTRTVAAAVTDDPPGLRDGGFELTEVVDPAENGGRQGVVSTVMLSPTSAVTLPATSDSTVLRISAELDPPAADASAPPCIVRFVEPGEQPLEGSGGKVETQVTVAGDSFRPETPAGAALRVVSGPCLVFNRGDDNQDGMINISDPQYSLNFQFIGGPAFECRAAADVNGDGAINIADAQYSLNFQFTGGPPPPAPFVGQNDAVGCEASDVPADIELGCVESHCR